MASRSSQFRLPIGFPLNRELAPDLARYDGAASPKHGLGILLSRLSVAPSASREGPAVLTAGKHPARRIRQ